MQKEESGVVSGNLFDIHILSRLFQFVKPYKNLFYTQVALTLTGAVLASVKPYLVKVAIDDKIASHDLNGLYVMIGLMVVVLVAQAFMQYFDTYLAGKLGQTIIRDIRIRLFKHLLKFRLGFFDKTPIGRLVTRNISDIETLSNFTSDGLAGILGDFLQLIFIFGFMLYIDWRLTLICLCPLPILLFSTYVFKERIKHSFNEVRIAVSNLNTFVQEHITGMSIVQIFNSEQREYAKFKKINIEHRDSNLKSVNAYSVYFPIAEFIGSLGLVLLIWFGSTLVLGETSSFGTLVSFIMYISMFFRPIRMIADRFNTLQLSVVSSDRILKLLDDHTPIQSTGEKPLPEIKGDVQFNNVFFSYIEGQTVLKDINFHVPQGGSIAFVGSTGAGKSSIINLLNRFYDIEKGHILIDGTDIRDYNLHELRLQIGLVLQDVFLFSGSIRNNITLYNPDITDEKIWEAIRMVGAERFIERLPGGLDYEVMERGSTLSSGQRQIISFIRVMVYDPKILILDEATSSIDSETEELIQEATAKIMLGRTSIIIAHRLSTIQHVDTIFVLEKGEIVESGSHEVLLGQQGLYSQLSALQYAAAKE
ncbi:ABC transporter ATP-binding protein [Cytophaga hutchinsonii]|uniref:ABC transporter, ATP-binding/membrane-spanning protein n=1 Tax=Cytophaga hutchinsonii (strain ATCC 33406 / DSM 1761 / CIP 103989 / NBRC 15051 / NCIMB 9469 / D465) TaxID=269798 RepID=A0A6N4SMU7_CYTH3|nr:ABC transporter ATP-binding protein [Cytophaga hutchinsonii]ABG57604.1 ABC transporter, ATP-binding/membrane-spanning protein [Cytophaga hutchinsonii ATCC 33406]SFX00944.1 ATP-binding cassette, subfamily B [Cytophaga hutchinsonii ATCC 33406]